jgi:hypothetical protein
MIHSLMKLNTTTLILGVALTVVAGLFGSTIFGLIGSNNNAQTSASATGLITGHVTSILTDSDGNIKAYRQSDNLIVNQGENCVAKMLFQSVPAAAGGTVCTGANTSGFRFIQIGNSTMPTASDQYKLGNPYNATSGVPSLVPKEATTITWTNSTGSGAGTTAQVVLSTTFTSTQTGQQTVSESGLFNSTNDNTNAMFARQQFTGINMNNGDSLTVQWTINIGGTGNTLTP